VSAWRAVAVLIALALAGLPGFALEASAQSACESRCQGNGACLKKCAQARKASAQKKQRPAPAGTSGSGQTSSSDWRSSIFSQSSGGGGGGY
jgi:hypothetical protein